MGIKGDALLRLFEAYGKQPNQAKMHYYEKWAHSLPIEKVESIIDSVVMEESFLPTPNKLFAMSRSRAVVDDSEPLEECWFCEESGLIPGVWKDQQNMWTHGIISACKCSNGERKSSYHIPQNNFEYDGRYIDLMKVGKEFNESPWGAVAYFNARVRTEAE